jgi:xylulokinase
LRAGVPIIAGCGDTAASFLACGATREGICVDVAGTASVFAAVTQAFLPDRQHKVLSCGQAATPGLWHPYAYINGGGMNLEWFRQHIKGDGRSLPTGLKFEDLDRQAERLVPTEGQPLFVPHLGGRVSPAWPQLRGAWANLNWTHGAAHLWRAMLEGVALEYAIYKQALLRLNPELRLSELRVTGGGERSALWNQIKADVLGTKVVQIARSEGAPAGAALLAAYGAGLVRDLDCGARQWLATGKVTRPNRRLAAYYETRLRRYGALLNALNSWS